MENKNQTKKVIFCCPYHGELREPIEYFNAKIGRKKLVNLPIMYCKKCEKYYTPFYNLVTLIEIKHKGYQVMASKTTSFGKNFKKVSVRIPRFIDIEEENKEENKEAERIRLEKKEKFQKYTEGLREVLYDHLVMTNKSCFIKEHMCPICRNITKKENIKITQNQKFLLANIRHCEYCNNDYITPEQFRFLCDKAKSKIRGFYHEPFIFPKNVICKLENTFGNQYLFIPEWALDFEKYDHHNLPPKGDKLYDMTNDEYLWVKMYYQPDEFPVKLRQKSILGEAGYSANESRNRRHIILAKCVKKYGKSRVINQLKSNINLRIKQKDGNIRYAKALNTWRGDITFVENEL
ncbi:MAG: hypothetical protein U0L18_04475 [Acutalibacteraceae bacterium]|nr:hypothetical protein [Acutalibacteraceae bacterium]